MKRATHQEGTIGRIDWEKWQERYQLALDEAILLSLGVDPDAREHAYDLSDPVRPLLPAFREEYPKRYENLRQALWIDEIDESFSTDILHQSINGDPRARFVRLTSFAAWCRKLRLKIPRELSQLASLANEPGDPPHRWDPQPSETLLQNMGLWNDERRITVVDYPFGNFQTVVMPLKDLIQQARKQIENRRYGYFSIGDAAMMIVESCPSFTVIGMISKIVTAVEAKTLRAYRGRGQGLLESAREISVLDSVVHASQINTWLEDLGFDYRFPVKCIESQEPQPTERAGQHVAADLSGDRKMASRKVMAVTGTQKHEIDVDKALAVNAGTENGAEPMNWIMQIQTEAAALWKRLQDSGASPTKNNIKDTLATWCRNNNVKTPGNICPSEGYISRHVLQKWGPPSK
jgi:hypothetical protein